MNADDLRKLIRRRFETDPDLRLWHRAPERAWTGTIERKDDLRVVLSGHRLTNTGLSVGQAEFIGLAAGGKFVAIQPLGPDERLRPEQRRFLETVREMGGYAGIARSLPDVSIILHGGEVW